MQEPKTFNLDCAFVSPAFLRAKDGEVLTPTTAKLNGVLCTLRVGDPPMVPGKRLVVKKIFYGADVYYEDEYLLWKAYKDEQNRLYWEVQATKKEQARLKYLENVRQFWASYQLPYNNYSPQIKERLSGLSANSSGNGMAKNTKYHLWRPETGFLCGAVKSKWGGDWSGSLGDDKNDNHLVTCATCLKKMEKWRKKTGNHVKS